MAFIRGSGVWIRSGRQAPRVWPEHKHARLQVTIALKGVDCQATWRNHSGRLVSHLLKPGEIWLIPPGIRHAARWTSEVELIILYVDPPMNMRGVDRQLVEPVVRSLRSFVDREPAIEPLCEAVRREVRQAIVDARHIASVGAALASFLFRAYWASDSGRIRKVRPLRNAERERIECYIEEHLSEEFSLRSLAKVAGLSPNYFCRTFAATMGVPPRKYFNGCRVRRAQELLATGRYTLSEVAFGLGFNELGHFNRVFRRHVHLPARSYLPSLAQSQPDKR